MNHPERNGTLPGIKKLAQKEEAIRSGHDFIIPGAWYVDGIRYDIARFEDTHRIIQEHKGAVARFKTFNERINRRALEKTLALTR